jgi:hypothetical protein
MDGWVALASVLATGAVGIGGLVITYKSGGAQRKHETRLAHTARVWEQKSQALLDVITLARRLIDRLDSPREAVRESFGVHLAEEARRLDELVAPIEAHASSECRQAFESLRSLLAESDFDAFAEDDIEHFRRQKWDALDAGDFEEAARARSEERATIKQANSVLRLDADEVRARARRVIETARASLRA